MPDTRDPAGGAGSSNEGPLDHEFAAVLRSFVRAHRKLLSLVPDRPLDQFIAFRDAVLDAAEREDIIAETSGALTATHRDPQTTHAAHLILLELRAFSSAVDVAAGAPAQVPEPAQRPLWKRLLGIGRTATDSLREILDRLLGERGKAIWKLLSEVAEIFAAD